MTQAVVNRCTGADIVTIFGTATLAAGTITVASGLKQVWFAAATFTSNGDVDQPITAVATAGSVVFTTAGGASTDTIMYKIEGRL